MTVSSCILAYITAIPFYLMVERPMKNFLDLILFPRSTIFKKSRDVDDEETEDESEEEEQDEKEVKFAMINGSSFTSTHDGTDRTSGTTAAPKFCFIRGI